jgi:hypothetical protein
MKHRLASIFLAGALAACGVGTDTQDGARSTPSPLDGVTTLLSIDGVDFPTKTTGEADHRAWNLYTNGYVEATVTFPSAGSYVFQIRAHGDVAANEWPTMELRIDGKIVETTSVASHDVLSFAFTETVSDGAHTIAIAFTNDYASERQDRNLYVDHLLVTGGVDAGHAGPHGGDDAGNTETSGPADHDASHPSLGSLRNLDPLFRKHESATRADISALGFAHPDFTEAAQDPDNGPQPTEGQFRILCQWSHYGYNDPIVKPGKPGAAHLHMFWGNTGADADSVSNVPSNPANVHELAERGGGTCQSFELNRSSYWMPALLDGSASPRNVVIPDEIVIYYKSKSRNVKPLPRGLQLLGGNVLPGGVPGATFTADMYGNYYDLFWSCGASGDIRNAGSSIPTNCRPGDSINATIRFPQCIAVDADNQPVLSSPDHLSHTLHIDDQQECPASHPFRIAEISYLVYFPNGSDGAGAGVSQWRLSSDMGTGVPGGSLHGDWFGGWNDEALKTWHEGCVNPVDRALDPRNCSQGQTGTPRSFRRVSPLNDYTGPNFMLLPE